MARDDSDYDSSSGSSSSLTVPDTSRSWPSISSRRSSISSTAAADSSSVCSYSSHKPHKSNQAAWEAMKRLRSSTSGGRIGLDHFHLLRRLGSGDIGNVYLCQIRKAGVSGLPMTYHQHKQQNSCFYAMKVVDREALALRNKLQRAEMEKEILGMLDHPFLPTLYAEFDAKHYSCLVMEYCPGGDLYAARLRQPGRQFSLSTAKFYAAEVLLALEYLHMLGIIYRDLKPENVLVREDGHIMLSDFDLSLKCDVVPKLLKHRRPVVVTTTQHFGRKDFDDNNFTPSCALPIQPVLSCFSSSTSSSCTSSRLTRLWRNKPIITTTIAHRPEPSSDVKVGQYYDYEYDPELVAEPINARSKSFVGTHEYLAPEVISGQGHGSAVDWWTFGVFLYEMLYGKTPFKGENNERTLVNILRQPLTFPRIGVSSAREYEGMVKVQDLISKLVTKNPKKRLGSVKGSVEIKRHEFFRDVNWALIRSTRPPEVPAATIKSVDACNHDKFACRGGGSSTLPKLRRVMSKKERDAVYQIPDHHFEYF